MVAVGQDGLNEDGSGALSVEASWGRMERGGTSRRAVRAGDPDQRLRAWLRWLRWLRCVHPSASSSCVLLACWLAGYYPSDPRINRSGGEYQGWEDNNDVAPGKKNDRNGINSISPVRPSPWGCRMFGPTMQTQIRLPSRRRRRSNHNHNDIRIIHFLSLARSTPQTTHRFP